jgi:two-component system chemotaxis response regulator CheB
MYPSMPENALRSVSVDHCVPLAEMPELLVRLAAERVTAAKLPRDPALERERRADEGDATHIETTNARPSPFSCPACHGVLWHVDDPDLLRFRCRVGHGYSVENLLADQDESAEAALWAAVRSLEELARLTRQMAAQWRERSSAERARELDQRATENDRNAQRIRELIVSTSVRR